MKKSYFLPFLAAALLATGCSKENGFDVREGEGTFLKSALSMGVNEGEYANVRSAADEVNVDDFTVIFTLDGHSEPSYKYTYGEMPEVVTLQAGTYTVTATYGQNLSAEWENPYFLGTSEAFEVNAYEIVSYLDPIVCSLENIMVTIDFDSSLRAAMSSDSYVEVKVGSSSSLTYGIDEADAQKAGYFKHSDEISLVAVFNGVVNGVETVETKSMKDIEKGVHYKITFKLHTGSDSDATGDADASVSVDAVVTTIDLEYNVEIGDDEVLDDSERPTEDLSEGGDESDPDDPSSPDDPSTPEVILPTITAQEPVDIDAVNYGSQLSSCVIDIHSSHEDGITALTCVIDSPTLIPEELASVGLASELDLVNPGDLEETLSALGFPVNVAGMNDVQFNLTNFLGLLAALGEGTHNFILTVSDAYGTTTKTLIIAY